MKRRVKSFLLAILMVFTILPTNFTTVEADNKDIQIIIASNIGEYLDKSFSKESRITLMLMVASTTIIYEVGIYIINIIKLNASIELALFLKILAIETIYNTIITIIMYPIIQRLGEKLESTFKPQTRGMYF